MLQLVACLLRLCYPLATKSVPLATKSGTLISCVRRYRWPWRVLDAKVKVTSCLTNWKHSRSVYTVKYTRSPKLLTSKTSRQKIVNKWKRRRALAKRNWLYARFWLVNWLNWSSAPTMLEGTRSCWSDVEEDDACWYTFIAPYLPYSSIFPSYVLAYLWLVGRLPRSTFDIVA